MLRRTTGLIGLTVLLVACDPTFNWRETHGSKQSFTVLLPAKPATMSRPLELNGLKFEMTMTAAETASMTFAVGSATIGVDKVNAMLQELKSGLVSKLGSAPGAKVDDDAAHDRVVLHSLDTHGKPILVEARFVSAGANVFQLMVVGPADRFSQEAADTFLQSFSPK